MNDLGLKRVAPGGCHLTAAEVLETVWRSGGEILVDGSQLHLLLPPDRISPHLLASVKERMSELLAIVAGDAASSVNASCLWILESVTDRQLRLRLECGGLKIQMKGRGESLNSGLGGGK